jgi:hypothetical protein
MKTYDIEALGYRSQIVELSTGGGSTVIGDFPSAMDAQAWLDSYLARLHSTGAGLSGVPENTHK